jgi:tripartite-type tricarboxylate transporter receptor subunit TctC
MKTIKMLGVAAVAASLALLGQTTTSFAQADDYPNKPIRMITGSGAGGSIDILSRALGEAITERTGEPFVHENMPGGRQVPATLAAIEAEPDGYTLLSVTQNAITLNPLLIEDLAYDPLKDLEPISLLVHQQHAITFRGPEGTDWKDWDYQDLVEYSKENPEKIFYGSIGIGSGSHLSFEWQMDKTGAKYTHVPYAGTGPLFQAFLAGDIQMFQLTVNQDVKGWYDDGTAKALAVPNKGGNPRLPGVPTFDEAIAEGYEYLPWTGWFAPAGTPKEIIDKLHGMIVEIMSDDEWVQRYVVNGGFLPVAMSPEEFRTYLEKDGPNHRALLAIAGVETVESN